MAVLWATNHIDHRRRIREIRAAENQVREKKEKLRPVVVWLNRVLRRMWFQFEEGISGWTVERLQPILDYYKPEYLEGLLIEELTFGTKV